MQSITPVYIYIYIYIYTKHSNLAAHYAIYGTWLELSKPILTLRLKTAT